jgi:hypothetical protein
MKRVLSMFIVCTLAAGIGIRRAKATCNPTNGNDNDAGCKVIGRCGLLSQCVKYDCGEPSGYVCGTPIGAIQCNFTGCAFGGCPNNCNPPQPIQR